MTQAYTTKQVIDHRYNKLLTGLAEAQKVFGVEPDDLVAFKNTEQNNARRQLLRVEKQAIRDKELNQKSEQNYINSIRDLVQDSILEKMQERLDDEDDIFFKVLGFDENLPELLDMLSVKASTISKLEPVAGEVSWLYEDLIKMVNMPKYRRTDAKGKVVAVDSLRVALSFLGIENLKLVVPSLAFRRWIPQITDPYPEIKSRLWETAIGTAMSCKAIASISKVDEGHAFAMGMFHDIGKIIVTRLYFRLFDEQQREALIEAHNERKREEHAALSKITPDSDFLIKLMDRFAAPISAQLIAKMGFKRLFIANAVDEYAREVSVKKMSPMGKVLYQGIAYNRYRMLKGNKLIEMEEAKAYLMQCQLPKGALSLLKTTDIRSLNISVDED